MQINTDRNYYNFIKPSFISSIPEGEHVIFDLGCGTGRLGQNLRNLKKASELVGVELYEAVANEAAKYYDKIYVGDLESLEFNYNEYFDYIICGDILEHLKDPWLMIKKIHRMLKKNGKVFCSIPNIRYWRILLDLLFLGKWTYTDAGIMDRTHLRFFTIKTIIDLFIQADYKIIEQEIWIGGKKQSFFNKITFNIFKEFLGSQIMVTAVK